MMKLRQPSNMSLFDTGELDLFGQPAIPPAPPVDPLATNPDQASPGSDLDDFGRPSVHE